MSGHKSQRKGANGERELVEILRKHGYDARRGGSLTFGTTPDVTGIPGVHIEVKRTERLDLYGAMEQAQRDAQAFQDGIPVVFHRRSRKPWVIIMPLEDWVELYRTKSEQ